MSQRIIDIANHFIAGRDCSADELAELKRWLADSSSRHEVERWLSENWFKAEEVESGALIETIFRQIAEYEDAHDFEGGWPVARLLKIYQKVAAFLFIPLLAGGILFWVFVQNRPLQPFTETFAPRGQKSQITLVDGTKVWLNSDTKIRYPGAFTEKQREVYLEGEAFFEVAKDAKHPFIVHTVALDVKVLGTKFNVKAYQNENQIETSLFEGKVDVLLSGPEHGEVKKKELTPGQSLVFNKTEYELAESRFRADEIEGWKKNQLIFKDDTFNKLVRKVERWYDVKVVYDEKQFSDRRLTVELYEGERLERLMEIIGMTLSVNYKYEKGKIILTSKAKKI